MTPEQMKELAAQLHAPNSRFMFQGGSHFAMELADLIDQMAQRVPLEDQIMAACYSFRHDFGLLPRHDQTALMNTAREWARCFGIRSEK